MIEIVEVNLENEMDLILAHKRSMKLSELCGLSVLVQTSFATAVSEISRCLITNPYNKSILKLGINTQRNNRKELIAVLNSTDDYTKQHDSAIKYATKLVDVLKINQKSNGTETILTQKINFSGLINETRTESFINYFKRELPLSPYDEIRKKNIQLLELSEKLKESENEYRSLTETLPLMMFTTNGTGHLTYGNKWLKDYFNLLEIIPGKLPWQNFLHIEKNTTVREEWEKSFLTQTPFTIQARLRSKGHEEPLWHLISLLPIKNESDQIISWTGFFVDIHAQKLVEETLKNNTELKAAQRQLLSYQFKLEEKVKELNKSNHDLEQFAYIASHDLQEPLRKIRSFSELLERNFDNKEAAKRYIEKIDYSSTRMQTLIKDVLNYSRLSKSETSFEDVDLQKIFNSVKIDVELIVEEKKAKLTSAKLPVINGIEQQLYQLFYNLIKNSLKFSYDNPVISLSCRNLSEAEIKDNPDLSSNTNYIELIFKDNGIGFEQKYAQQIFTIFKRLNSKGIFEGTGIGLALCKKIVDNHHGAIKANSIPDKGTEFSVILPVE